MTIMIFNINKMMIISSITLTDIGITTVTIKNYIAKLTQRLKANSFCWLGKE